MVARARGHWSCYACSQEEGEGECFPSDHSFLFLQARSLVPGMALSVVRVSLPHVCLAQVILHRHGEWLFHTEQVKKNIMTTVPLVPQLRKLLFQDALCFTFNLFWCNVFSVMFWKTIFSLLNHIGALVRINWMCVYKVYFWTWLCPTDLFVNYCINPTVIIIIKI